ncbi:MAG: terminase small subunit [Zoogloeaceae bacterium]|jgi:hypothetical protein|nr:terminase small subunit [Zoogloeaceae bacterium]
MAAPPKLSPQKWAAVRTKWENDPRNGYTWLVAEMELPVSAPAVRKTAVRDEWLKKTPLHLPGEKPTPETIETKAKTGKSAKQKATSGGKVSRRKVSKVSGSGETIDSETIETLPMTTAQAVERDPDEFGVFADLTDQQEIFVREYLVDWNASAAAIRAGYSPKAAMQQGWSLLQNPKVSHAIVTLATARARRLGIDGDELMRLWAAIVTFDANEISQLRRVCCPYCWGEGHARQYTPSGLEEAKKKHDRERARRKKADSADDIGEFPDYTDAWYDKRKAPHEDCPECHGHGIEEVFFNDTRNLSPAARLVYCGVKVGKEGIEVLMLSKEKAMDNLARALGLFKEKETEVNINMVSGDELFRLYEEKMQQARERQALVLSERGLIVEPDVEQPGGGG